MHILNLFIFRFDGTVTSGDILTILSILIGALGLYTRISDKLAKLSTKVEVMYDWWKDEISPKQRGSASAD